MNQLGSKPGVIANTPGPELSQQGSLIFLGYTAIPFSKAGQASSYKTGRTIEASKYPHLPALLADAGAGQLPPTLEGADFDGWERLRHDAMLGS
jgi:hypothetical protein